MTTAKPNTEAARRELSGFGAPTSDGEYYIPGKGGGSKTIFENADVTAKVVMKAAKGSRRDTLDKASRYVGNSNGKIVRSMGSMFSRVKDPDEAEILSKLIKGMCDDDNNGGATSGMV